MEPILMVYEEKGKDKWATVNLLVLEKTEIFFP
jgi:hypothetical protein